MEDQKLWELLLQKEEGRLNEVLACGPYMEYFGLNLTQEDARQLLCNHRNCLAAQERVEFRGSILPKLMEVFCDSVYLFQDNYVNQLSELMDVFYLYKNESMDLIPDEELLNYMKIHFELDCHGSVELLADTCLEEFARDIRQHGLPHQERYSQETIRCRRQKHYSGITNSERIQIKQAGGKEEKGDKGYGI